VNEQSHRRALGYVSSLNEVMVRKHTSLRSKRTSKAKGSDAVGETHDELQDYMYLEKQPPGLVKK
jgi:hypothetical protein